MTSVKTFTFNPYQENTFILYDESKECAIFDPGCYEKHEEETLLNFIANEGLKPVRLINTHCHIDHILGNALIADRFGLDLEIHEGELPVMNAVPAYASALGLRAPKLVESIKYLTEKDTVEFGSTSLKILFTPGHSPASLSFYCKDSSFIIGGDVLFQMSIGRTDLPGGNFDTLINSIRTQFFTLDDEVIVYCGHGPETSIGFEKKNNPFLT